ncbi:unnamed protein product [Moneuplotes crassus]|uniref:Homeobox domain-containing protein n=1 Tax=Euplotes crassus TaxID=5936 RepID=A0AAD1XBK9_EUPCR|nr:unnamed protein product [Moneuplotes crassus]
MNNFTQNLSKKQGNRTGIKNIGKWKKSILLNWIREHRDSPYPTEDEKYQLAEATQLTVKQISNWFTNARKRNSSEMDSSKLIKRRKRVLASMPCQPNFQKFTKVNPEIKIPHMENMTHWEASTQQFAMSVDKFCFCSIDEDLNKLRHQFQSTFREEQTNHCIDLFWLLQQ